MYGQTPVTLNQYTMRVLKPKWSNNLLIISLVFIAFHITVCFSMIVHFIVLPIAEITNVSVNTMVAVVGAASLIEKFTSFDPIALGLVE